MRSLFDLTIRVHLNQFLGFDFIAQYRTIIATSKHWKFKKMPCCFLFHRNTDWLSTPLLTITTVLYSYQCSTIQQWKCSDVFGFRKNERAGCQCRSFITMLLAQLFLLSIYSFCVISELYSYQYRMILQWTMKMQCCTVFFFFSKFCVRWFFIHPFVLYS